MNVLVTGGAGFIGAHLVDQLLADGHTVRVLDDCSTGRRESLAHAAAQPRLTFMLGSVLEPDVVADAMHDAELVYHLAAAVGVGHVLRDPLWALETNLRGTEVVLARAIAVGARVVFASTSEIYGASDALPFREDGPRVLGPTWVHRWGYSTAKAAGEHLCFALADRGLAVTVVRYFNTYGPRMDPAGYGSVVARFVSQALAGTPLTVHGDGEQTRCFTYVTETVAATIRAGTLAAAVGEAINVGSGFRASINALAEQIVAIAGSPSPIHHVPYADVYGPGFADTRHREPDVAKAADLLEWRAEIPLDEGLRRVVDAARAAPGR